MNIMGRDLQKLEAAAVPVPLLEAAQQDPQKLVNVSPEILAMSEAFSLKRIADALEDGLTHLDPKSGGVFGLADILAARNAE